MIQGLTNMVMHLLPNRTTYRLGRNIYMRARGEVPNYMASNGEALVQSSAIEGWKKTTDRRRFVAFDVGANVGDWSSSLISKLASRGVVHEAELFAFEPVPATASTLRARLPMNEAWVHIEEVAMSSQPGSSQIFISAPNAGTNSLHAATAQGAHTLEIALDTVANFCEGRAVRHIHLLKVDTEGHDMEVLRGAKPLLQEGRISLLQFEYNHRWVFSRNFLLDAFKLIEGMPYRLAKLQGDGLLLLRDWHPELEKFFEGNYALVHESALPWFSTREILFDRFNVPTQRQRSG